MSHMYENEWMKLAKLFNSVLHHPGIFNHIKVKNFCSERQQYMHLHGGDESGGYMGM